MQATFADPICQHPGCSNPTEAYVDIAATSSVPSRFEARCSEHGAVPYADLKMVSKARWEAALKLVEAARIWANAGPDDLPAAEHDLLSEITAVEAWEAGAE